MECVYCSKICKNENSKRNHQRLCKSNNSRQISSFVKYNEQLVNGLKTKTYKNQYSKAKDDGVNPPILTDECRKKLSITAKIRNSIESHSTKQKRIDTITARISNGEWHTGGRAKRIFDYGIWFDSSWEHAYARFLTSNHIEWVRNKQYFVYVDSKTNTIRRYFPDFYLPDSDTFVEIKGRVTQKDYDKWKHFPKDKKLQILKCKDLRNLGIKI